MESVNYSFKSKSLICSGIKFDVLCSDVLKFHNKKNLFKGGF
jgi:hypothetical protein